MLKNGSKNIYSASKMIYVESIRKLSDEFNSSHTPVSMSVFFSYKPFYCVRPSEKEKQSCVCINCNNPHLLLKAINTYRNSKKLHQSLTSYIHALKSGTKSHQSLTSYIHALKSGTKSHQSLTSYIHALKSGTKSHQSLTSYIHALKSGTKSHQSLTSYIHALKSGTKFDELDDDKLCKFHLYERVTESFIGKEGKPPVLTTKSPFMSCLS